MINLKYVDEHYQNYKKSSEKQNKINEEIKQAEKILKKYNAKIIDIIEYELPTAEKLERYLIVIRK